MINTEKKTKYVMIDDTIEERGNTLRRIKAVRDFGNVKVGDLGGYIEKESNLSHFGNCWVYDGAAVYERAQVFDNVKVSGSAEVYGYAKLFDNSSVCHGAQVFGYAKVRGNAKVCDDAMVSGSADVGGNASVYDDGCICGNASAYDNAMIEGYVSGSSIIYKDGFVDEHIAVEGKARISKHCDTSNIKVLETSLYTVTIYDKWIEIGIYCNTIEYWDLVSLESTHKKYGLSFRKWWKEYREIVLQLAGIKEITDSGF